MLGNVIIRANYGLTGIETAATLDDVVAQSPTEAGKHYFVANTLDSYVVLPEGDSGSIVFANGVD